MAGFAYLEHPDLGTDGQPASCQVPDVEDVIEHYVSRGWVVKPTPIELDPDAPNTGALPANAFLQELAAAEQAAELEQGDQADAEPAAAPEQPAPRPVKNRTAAPADDKNGE